MQVVSFSDMHFGERALAVEATLLSDPPVSGAPLRIVPGTLRGDAVVLGAAALVAASDRSFSSEQFAER